MSEKVQIKGSYGAITLTIWSSQQPQPLTPLCAIGSLPPHTYHLEALAHFSQVTSVAVFTAMPPSENGLHWLSMFPRFLPVLMHRRQFLLFGPSMVLKHILFFLGILSGKVRFSLLFNPPSWAKRHDTSSINSCWMDGFNVSLPFKKVSTLEKKCCVTNLVDWLHVSPAIQLECRTILMGQVADFFFVYKNL